MEDQGVIAILILLANFAISYYGFRQYSFFEKYLFHVDKILVDKEYYRLISSGFLHSSWPHLLLNMLTLFFFSDIVTQAFGEFPFALIYFSSLIGGDLLALWLHRNHEDYRAVGASGAVSGVIFAYIALVPDGGLLLLGFLPMKAWVFGLLYVVYSIYGIKSQLGNIGHDAHLGGALIGMVVALLLMSGKYEIDIFPILFILIPTLAFIVLTFIRPEWLMLDKPLFQKKQEKFYTFEDKYNAQKRERLKELDRILEKIHQKGVAGLTKKERAFLKENSPDAEIRNINDRRVKGTDAGQHLSDKKLGSHGEDR